MALSYVQKLGDGTTRNFDFTFDYLSRKHITVSVNGVSVPFTWTSTYSILVATAPTALAVVEVRRTTPRTERLVSFTDGSTLVATDLNTSSLQSFFLAQEAFDQGAASLAVTEDGQYSAQTRRITNLGDPIANQDAVTKAWALNTTNTNVAGAVAAKDTAVAANANAQSAKTASEAARDIAVTARTDAQEARDSASGHRLNASNAKTAAEAARDIAVTKASEAAVDRAAVALDAAAARTARNEAQGFAASINPSLLLTKAANLSDLTDKLAARLNLKIWTGTTAAYTALPTKDADTIYFAT